MESLDNCTLWFHEHYSLALLPSYLARSLDIDKLFSRYQVAFPECSLEGHPFWTVVDHEGFKYAFLTHEQGSEIKTICLVVLVIDNVARMLNRSSVYIDRILHENRL